MKRMRRSPGSAGRRRSSRRFAPGSAALEGRPLLAGDLPLDLGTLSGRRFLEDFVGSNDPVDLFAFRLAEATDLMVTSTWGRDRGTLRLAHDRDQDGAIDDDDVIMYGFPDFSGGAQTLAAPAGRYLAEVTVEARINNTPDAERVYRLHMNFLIRGEKPNLVPAVPGSRSDKKRQPGCNTE